MHLPAVVVVPVRYLPDSQMAQVMFAEVVHILWTFWPAAQVPQAIQVVAVVVSPVRYLPDAQLVQVMAPLELEHNPDSPLQRHDASSSAGQPVPLQVRQPPLEVYCLQLWPCCSPSCDWIHSPPATFLPEGQVPQGIQSPFPTSPAFPPCENSVAEHAVQVGDSPPVARFHPVPGSQITGQVSTVLPLGVSPPGQLNFVIVAVPPHEPVAARVLLHCFVLKVNGGKWAFVSPQG